jgi:hypothetical protein
MYGPTGPWGALGAFGADKRPTPVCGTPASPANCAALSDAAYLEEAARAAAGTSLKGAGLPPNWSGLTPPPGASLPWPAFDVSANKGSGVWVGPSARWGRYASCRPILNNLTSAAATGINAMQAASSAFSAIPANKGKAYDWAGSAHFKAMEPQFLGNFTMLYDCFCDMTPMCFLGIHSLDTNDLMDPAVIQSASTASPRTAAIIARLYSAGLLLRRPPPATSAAFVDKLYGGLARLIDQYPAAYVAAQQNKWLVANNMPQGAPYGGPPVTFEWASKANRAARLMQLLDGSYDQDGVYALSQVSRPDVPVQYNAFAPYGLGAFTWPWTAPCDNAVMGMASAYWKPNVVAEPLIKTPWASPAEDFSYGSTTAGFTFRDFADRKSVV